MERLLAPCVPFADTRRAQHHTVFIAAWLTQPKGRTGVVTNGASLRKGELSVGRTIP